MARPSRRTPIARPAAPVPPVPLPALAWTLLVALAAGFALLLVSYPIYDTDMWQHLLVGKVIWTQPKYDRCMWQQ